MKLSKTSIFTLAKLVLVSFIISPALKANTAKDFKLVYVYSNKVIDGDPLDSQLTKCIYTPSGVELIRYSNGQANVDKIEISTSETDLVKQFIKEGLDLAENKYEKIDISSFPEQLWIATDDSIQLEPVRKVLEDKVVRTNNNPSAQSLMKMTRNTCLHILNRPAQEQPMEDVIKEHGDNLIGG